MSGSERVPEPLKAAKEDPETLVLRGRPRPAIRFRRGLIIGVSGAMTAALMALTLAALEPPSFRLAGAPEAGVPAGRAEPDGIADAPASYAEVPRLGPPLPGDLGRAVLEQQRMLEGAAGGDGQAIAAREEIDRRRQNLAEQAESARTSPVLVRLDRPAPVAEGRPSDGTALPAGRAAGASLQAPAAAAGQQRKIDFARGQGGGADPHLLVGPPSPWTLAAGTVIPASLITGLNSDLPGIVLAQVTENVRDSATGSRVLVPQGARLIGQYDSVVDFGQKRALIVWQRILFPDGSSVRLGNVPAADLAGFAGLEDRVDFHQGRLLKGIALSSLLGAGSELSLGSGSSDLAEALERSVQRDGARAGDRLVSRNLDVQPTLTVRPGWPVRALIHEDLVLRPWKE